MRVCVCVFPRAYNQEISLKRELKKDKKLASYFFFILNDGEGRECEGQEARTGGREASGNLKEPRSFLRKGVAEIGDWAIGDGRL